MLTLTVLVYANFGEDESLLPVPCGISAKAALVRQDAALGGQK
jgi:hypothetical protein